MENSFDILNSYFDKILVITLDRATDRHQEIKEQLKGLNFEFFYGVDKYNFTLEETIKNNVYDDVQSRKQDLCKNGMSLGSIACSWSHLNVYKEVLEKGYEKVLIFEDDAKVIKENIKYLNDIISQLPNNWELLYLGYIKNTNFGFPEKIKNLFYQIYSALGFGFYSRQEYKNYFSKPFSPNLRIAGYHDCAHSYAITKSCAETLVREHTPIIYRADNLLSRLIIRNKIKAYISVPPIFMQDFLTSL
jgi:Glycosyltransferase involved in LPS biosynthesis